jgi:hypothetical protein
MKRLFIFVVTLLMVFSIAACSKSESAGSNLQGNEKAGQEETSQTGSGERIVCESFAAFKEARDKFDDYVLNQNYELVNVNLPVVSVFDANIFEYIMPLDFIGQSILTSGKFDVEMETQMLQKAWAVDALLTYDQAAGYLLKGTNTQNNKLEIKVKFDEEADLLRLECYKDGSLNLIFEYLAIDGGYAAQYYSEAITGYDKTTPIMGLCTHRLIFSGNNGSRARYDNVASEPDSILGSTPDLESFIDGANHWFTINKGQFSGNINGKAF